jgi:hypothetical protein
MTLISGIGVSIASLEPSISRKGHHGEDRGWRSRRNVSQQLNPRPRIFTVLKPMMSFTVEMVANVSGWAGRFERLEAPKLAAPASASLRDAMWGHQVQQQLGYVQDTSSSAFPVNWDLWK